VKIQTIHKGDKAAVNRHKLRQDNGEKKNKLHICTEKVIHDPN